VSAPAGFTYQDGQLCADNVRLTDLAAEFGTPFYCYAASTIAARLTTLQTAFKDQNPLIAYAMKANANQAILTLLAKRSIGADVVSLGELERAIAAGFPPDKIVFSGVGKSEVEIRRGLELNIHCFNVESEPELARIDKIAERLGKIAPVSVRINPNVDAKTHAKISTGKSENKFGIPFTRARDVYAAIAMAGNLNAIGVDMHIGSQITDLTPFGNAFALLAELVTELRTAGHQIKHIDIGGGLGIAYHPAETPPDLSAYARLVRARLGGLGCQLILEPGRWLVADAGVLVTRVEYIKQGATHPFVIVDAAMNDLLRPTLYDAHHHILPLKENADGATLKNAEIVGPICETGDYLAKNRDLPALTQGDLIAITGTGAYGAVMSGTYNTRPLIAEILVDGEKTALIRPRQKLKDLIGLDQVPDWL